MKIAIDAMGGDFAPLETVLGSIEAVRANEHIEVVLVGDEQQIFNILEARNEAKNPTHFLYTMPVKLSVWMSIQDKHCVRKRMHPLW